MGKAAVTALHEQLMCGVEYAISGVTVITTMMRYEQVTRHLPQPLHSTTPLLAASDTEEVKE